MSHIENHKTVKMAKTWQYNTNFSSATNIRQAIIALEKNIRQDIQFDHNSNILFNQTKATPLYYALSKPSVMRSIMTKLAVGISVKEAIEYFIDEVSKANEDVRALSEISKRMEMNTAGNHNLTVNAISLALSKALYSYKKNCVSNIYLNSFKMANEIKPLMIIPKNSDKASLDRREFIAKSQIAETILTSIVLQNVHIPVITNPQYSKITYIPFGSRVIDKHSEEKGFSHYITEYNLYRSTVTSEANKKQYFKAFDISKFFASINIKDLVSMLSEDVFKNNQSRRFSKKQYQLILEQLFAFEYYKITNSDEKVIESAKGLTIESHTQHVLANYFLNKVITEALQYGVLEKPKSEVTVCSYVDDFVILGNSKEDVNTVYYNIAETLLTYGLEISEEKTTDVLSTSRDRHELKELVRLPGRSYFDINNSEMEENTEGKQLVTGVKLPYINKDLKEMSGDDLTIGSVKAKDYADFIELLNNNYYFKNSYNCDLIGYVLSITSNGYSNEMQFFRMLQFKEFAKLPVEIIEFIALCMIFSLDLKDRQSVVFAYNTQIAKLISDKINKCIKNNTINFSKAALDCMYKAVNSVCISARNAIIINFKNDTSVSKLALQYHSIQKLLMAASDQQWLVENYETIQCFDLFKANALVSSLNDSNILNVLQYFYLTLNRPTDFNNSQFTGIKRLLIDLNTTVITKYPSKIRFMCAINKVFVRRQISVPASIQINEHGESEQNGEISAHVYTREIVKLSDQVIEEVLKFTKKKLPTEAQQAMNEILIATKEEQLVSTEIAKLAFSGKTFEDCHPFVNSVIYFTYRMFNRNKIVDYTITK